MTVTGRSARLMLVAMAGLVAACGSGDGDGAATTTTTLDSAEAEQLLEGVTWELAGGQILLPLVEKNAQPTISFTGNTASVWTGCRTFTASYTVATPSLRFEPLEGDQRGCRHAIQAAIDEQYLARLEATSSFSVSPDALYLRDDQGSSTLFVAAGAVGLDDLPGLLPTTIPDG